MQTIDRNRTIRVMGILNVTPDSFYAPSRYNMSILDSGADIVDIGAYSTRPGHQPVSVEEEWSRLQPVLKKIASGYPDLMISVDTFRSEIVRRTYDIAGRFIVNDVSGGDCDESMLSTVAELGLPYIAMHHGPAESMDVITSHLDRFAGKASDLGITEWYADPGFGFGKSVEQNLGILHGLRALTGYGSGMLVGISRKRMTWEQEGGSPENALEATARLHLTALENGADILRVHDVDAARSVIQLYRNHSSMR